jgi:plastocyanin
LANNNHIEEVGMKSHLNTALAVTSVALAVAGPAVARPAKTTTDRVTAKDSSFALSTRTVEHGKVTFVLKNEGHTMHDFEIAGHASKTIGPGKKTTLTVTLKPGQYSYKCTVDAHAKLGMKGVLRVK